MEQITIEDFAKIEMRVGKIETAEAIEGSDKLIKLQVDFGEVGKRQILSGIKKSYAPEALVGRSFIFVTNLKSRKFMLGPRSPEGEVGGLESQGMILAVSDPDGLPVLYTFDKEILLGTKVK